MVYYFYFLSVFISVGMLLVEGQDSRRPMVPITFFVGCIFIYSKTCSFSSALLAVLHVYSPRWLFIALPIYGVLKKLCKATDIVARIPRIHFFLLGPLVLQS